MNGTLYFRASDAAAGSELWRSDGTEAGTVIVKDINPGTGNSWSSNLVNVNGVLYFIADNGTNGWELWRSDGAEVGTVMVKDIYAGAISSSPYWLTNVNSLLYFVAADGTNGRELWRSDGTAAGTFIVKDIYPGVDSSVIDGFPSDVTNVNGTLYFTANNGANGIELWGRMCLGLLSRLPQVLAAASPLTARR